MITLSKDFIRWLKLRHSPLTVKQYIYVLTRFINSNLTILQYADTISDRKKFLTQFRACVINYAKYYKSKGDLKIHSQIMNQVDSIYVQRSLTQIPKTLNDEELKIIGEHIKQMIIQSTKDYQDKIPCMIIAFLLYAGMRLNETINLRKGLIQTKEGIKIIMIPKEIGKGGKERMIPMSNTLIKLYNEFTKDIPEDQDYLFLTISGKPFKNDNARLHIKRAEKQADMPRYINPHAYRHTFATKLINQGVNLEAIKMLMGHSSIQTTSIYLHVSFKDLKEAVNK